MRQTLGLVTQDGHLFHESVRDNLLLANEAATEDELWAGAAPGPAGRSGRGAAGRAGHRGRGARATGCPAASGSG